MTFLHEEKNSHNHTDEKKGYGAQDRYSSEPQKGTSHWWVCNFGKVWSTYVASFSLYACKCDQAGREGGRLKT